MVRSLAVEASFERRPVGSKVDTCRRQCCFSLVGVVQGGLDGPIVCLRSRGVMFRVLILGALSLPHGVYTDGNWVVQGGAGACLAWLLTGEVGEIVLCPLTAQLSTGSYLFPLTSGETEAHRAEPFAQGQVKMVVRDPVWSPDASILLVAFPKISPARETEAAGLLVGSSRRGGDSCAI